MLTRGHPFSIAIISSKLLFDAKQFYFENQS